MFLQAWSPNFTVDSIPMVQARITDTCMEQGRNRNLKLSCCNASRIGVKIPTLTLNIYNEAYHLQCF